MTAVTVDQLVNDYLSRLEAAAADLPDARRAELLGEIREHIEAARSEGVAADEATTRTMLDQLGEPEEIAAAARAELDDSRGDVPPPAMVESKPGTGLELAAVLLLTIGSLIPLVGWAVGVVLLWASRRWTTREKLLGTLVVPTGPGGLFYVGTVLAITPTRVCTGTATSDGDVIETCSGWYVPAWVALPLFLLVMIAPFVVAGVLYSRARARADAEPPVRRPAGTLAARRSLWTGTEITAVALLAAGSVTAFLLFPPPGVLIAVAASLPFVWASSQWTQQEKWNGTALAIAPFVALIPVAVLLGLGSPIYGAVIVGPVAAAVYLAIALNKRRTDGATRR